jgi:hypothetical protein
MPEPHFFQAFFGPQGQQAQQGQGQQIPQYLIHNETILEIINNWEYVVDLMERHRSGKLKQVDDWEHLWYNFIISKNIDITQYKNKEEFCDTFWKIPTN